MLEWAGVDLGRTETLKIALSLHQLSQQLDEAGRPYPFLSIRFWGKTSACLQIIGLLKPCSATRAVSDTCYSFLPKTDESCVIVFCSSCESRREEGRKSSCISCCRRSQNGSLFRMQPIHVFCVSWRYIFDCVPLVTTFSFCSLSQLGRCGSVCQMFILLTSKLPFLTMDISLVNSMQVFILSHILLGPKPSCYARKYLELLILLMWLLLASSNQLVGLI